MEIRKKISSVLVSKARSLESLGLQEVAWTKSATLELLGQLKGQTVVVLGGDVYCVALGSPTPTYENWSCERRLGENLAGYSARSQQEAVAFVRAYPDLPETLFSLVLDEEETAGL